MTRTALKVKYKNSVLGFVWSMLNPALYLVVYYVVFQVILKNGVPYFTIYLLSGLLVWNLFSGALAGATGSIVGNSGLIKKVDFPREVLPLAAVGAALVHFFLQTLVLFGALAVFRYGVNWPYVPLLVPALLVLLLLAAAIGVLLSAINVYMRDMQHMLELLLLAWFWGTPIVWYFGLVEKVGSSRHALLLLNPVASVTLTFQRALYGRLAFTDKVGKRHNILPDYSILQHLELLGAVLVASFAILWLAFVVFGRLEGNFAEEL
ncbi:MAG: lipopolysaccharide transport system permease protein [Actinomycetota bacterium]|nr:lipopolysaccharide transport system permease protein [Actinomycetota bacterium]